MPLLGKPGQTALDEIAEDDEDEEDDPQESESETSLVSGDDDQGELGDTLDDRAQTAEEWRQEDSGSSVMYSQAASKLLVGDIGEDIPENIKVVRIFTSSTFTGEEATKK